MVSRFKYTSFKGGPKEDVKNDRVPFWVILLIVAILIALFVLREKALLAVAALYALSGPAMWLYSKIVRKPVA